jgi:hypothetical protein
MESNKRPKLSEDELEVMYDAKRARTWRDLKSTPAEVKEEFKEPIHFRIEFQTDRNLKENDKAIRLMDYELIYYPETDKLVLLDPENYLETKKLTKDDKWFVRTMYDLTDQVDDAEDAKEEQMPEDGLMFSFRWQLEDQSRMLKRDELMKYVLMGYHILTVKRQQDGAYSPFAALDAIFTLY